MTVSTHTAMSESGQTQKVKWCCAHVTIAKQIQAHQQQTKVGMGVCVCVCVCEGEGGKEEGRGREGGREGGISVLPSLNSSVDACCCLCRACVIVGLWL